MAMETMPEAAMDENVLAARHYLYRTFQCLLGNDPRDAAWESLDGELAEEACALMGVDGAELVRLVGEALDADGGRDELARQYAVALVGPGALASPPWESAQLSGGGALFTPVTLEVRNAYRVQGLLPEQYPTVADDHIALECGFLAELAGRALEALAAHDGERCAAALAASRSFAEAHPLRWVDRFAEWMDSECAPFYRVVAFALADFAQADAAWLREAAAAKAAA